MRQIILLFFFLGCACFAFFAFTRQVSTPSLRVIACDVGQGDGVLIISPTKQYVLIDGGPDEKMLECLSRYMAFWERSISLVVLSHPHLDHFAGLIPVIDRYITKHYASEELHNNTPEYKALLTRVKNNTIPIQYLYAKDVVHVDDSLTLEVLSPSRKMLERTSPDGNITDRKEFTNLLIRIRYDEAEFLFTGDSQAPILTQELLQPFSKNIRVLQIPHHGSRFGLTKALLTRLRPTYGFISVGKNSYGHPAPLTLQLLEESNIPYLRTDRGGDIIFTTDGHELSITRRN